MVQMKDSRLNIIHIFLSNLYIPHGSDESDRKRYSIIKRTSRLYIPHGSDERLFFKKLFSWMKNFISHMVQMKEGALTAQAGTTRVLYIPHGSDEST